MHSYTDLGLNIYSLLEKVEIATPAGIKLVTHHPFHWQRRSDHISNNPFLAYDIQGTLITTKMFLYVPYQGFPTRMVYTIYHCGDTPFQSETLDIRLIRWHLLCVCVYICVCVYTCVCVHAHMFVSLSLSLWMCMCTRAHACMCVCTCEENCLCLIRCSWMLD